MDGRRRFVCAEVSWVEALLADERTRDAAAEQRRAGEPVSRGTEAVVGGFMLLVLALFVLGIGAPVALAVARGVARVGAEA